MTPKHVSYVNQNVELQRIHPILRHLQSSITQTFYGERLLALYVIGVQPLSAVCELYSHLPSISGCCPFHILPKEVLCSRKLLFVSIKCSYFWLDTSKTLIKTNILVLFTWTASSVDKLHSESLRCSCIHLGSLLRLSARENLYNKCTILISLKLHCSCDTTRD